MSTTERAILAHLEHLSTTHEWRRALRDLLDGHKVVPTSAGADWRGRTTRELVGYRTFIPMNRPVVLSPTRKLLKKFLVAEAAWIASGDNRVETIEPFAPKIYKSFSDDGVRYFGAYGTKLIEQLTYAKQCLLNDVSSRQAVINIWRENPRSSKDVPCTLSWQFLIRPGVDGFPKICTVATMRSSDVWSGWVYDVFNFSIVTAVLALELRATNPELYGNLDLGYLQLTAGSQHLYEMDVLGVEEVLRTDVATGPAIHPLNLPDFASPQELIKHLWALARNDGTAKHQFLRELFQ